MREDTGFLFGSITKTMTSTMLMQQVERGVLDLEDRVITHLPEFHLTDPAAAESIRIRHLLTHTNEIDARPTVRGRQRSRVAPGIPGRAGPTMRSALSTRNAHQLLQRRDDRRGVDCSRR
jgi:CubicO group peptidase (beta-lactamase class C family)